MSAEYSKNNKAHDGIWTRDLTLTKGVLYPWATWAEWGFKLRVKSKILITHNFLKVGRTGFEPV